MLDTGPSIFSVIALAVMLFLKGISLLSKGRITLPPSFPSLWMFFLSITVAEWFSFSLALWLLALVSFCALREYLSLVDIRLEDRWGILVSYLSIPFMFYLIHIEWYGFFIIAIPVYAFLLVPFFVALGGRSRGIVFSVGALDFILAVTLSGWIHKILGRRPVHIKLPLQLAAAVPFCIGLASWTAIPAGHAAILGILIPVSVCLCRYTLKELEQDLGIRADRLQPGRGRTIEGLKSYLYTAPIVFHYLRWFLKWGDL
jgi:predicted CDP-diglyceride synthetase/phosphatidate cytidylyltransferase